MKEFLAITNALSDPNRLRAFMALQNGELCVCQIIELLGLAPSTVSKHMSLLKQAGLVQSRKDSRWVYYTLAGDHNDKGMARQFIQLAISSLGNDQQMINDRKHLKEISPAGADGLCRQP